MNYLPQIINFIEKEYSENVGVKYSWINDSEYKNGKIKNLELIDENGYRYRVSLRNIIRYSNATKSPLKPFSKTNPYLIQNVNLHLVLNKCNIKCLSCINNKSDNRMELKFMCENGHDFSARYDVFSSYYNFKCPHCDRRTKENDIRDILILNKVYFDRQYTFSDCRYKNLLRFDFAIFEDEEKTKLKCLIEYDGEFHYMPIMGEEKLQYQKKNDKIKNNYCKDIKIKLLRIPYWDYENIEQILVKEKIIYGN